jgi:predicted porin
MKKLGLVALATLMAAGGAHAQVGATGAGRVAGSSVNLFGVVDVALAWGQGDIADRLQVVSGANTSSRLGFRGYEDLGGGLAAGFWLEAGVNPDNATGSATNTNNTPAGGALAGMNGSQGLTFNRRSTVSLVSDAWGEIRLGRDYTATFRNRDQTDPFGTNGAGANQANAGTIAGVTSTRASNMVGYFLPHHLLGGFFGEFQFFMGEQASNAANDRDGDGWQARLGYASGPWGLALAAGTTKYAQTATTGDIDVWNIGGHFNFGFGRITAGYFEDKVKSFSTLKGTGYIVGGVFPFGATDLKVAFSSYGTNAAGDPETRKLAVGAVHNLSKRTSLYATYARADNHGPAAVGLNGSSTGAGKNSDGFDIGLKHSF